MSSDTTTPWVKARLSDEGQACVEQRRHAGMVEVRDTKDAGTGPVLRFSPAAYAAWLDSTRHGEWDSLID